MDRLSRFVQGYSSLDILKPRFIRYGGCTPMLDAIEQFKGTGVDFWMDATIKGKSSQLSKIITVFYMVTTGAVWRCLIRGCFNVW